MAYARVEWTVNDVLERKPEWTEEQAEAWLEEHENEIADRLTERGQQVLADLLAMEK